MPMIEIDETELQANRQLRALASKMMANPTSRKLLEQAHKAVDPNAATPALSAEQQLLEPINALRTEFSELSKTIAAQRAEDEKKSKLNAIQQQIEDGKAALRRQGWTAEGIKGVEELMEQHGLLDVEIAAAAFEKKHPPQNVVNPSGSGAWNFMGDMAGDGDADLKKLLDTKGESAGLVDKMANDALNEYRSQVAQRR